MTITEPVVLQRTCRSCGCTDDHACTPICWWIESDLCSTCAAAKVLVSHREQRDQRAATIGCSCGWSPTTSGDKPSFLRQYAAHVFTELVEATS